MKINKIQLTLDLIFKLGMIIGNFIIFSFLIIIFYEINYEYNIYLWLMIYVSFWNCILYSFNLKKYYKK